MKNKIIAVLIVAFSLSLSSMYGQSYAQSPKVQQSGKNTTRQINYYSSKFQQALSLISSGYLDSVQIDKLTESAIIEMITKLDPHSAYISAKDVKAMEEPLIGNFDGIGIEYAIISDTLTVQAVIAGGPSEKVGLLAGDKIVTVDGENISGTGLNATRVINYLRGPKGSKVKIGYLRRSMGLNEVVITRDKIPLNTVDCSYEISKGILYVRINRFGAETYKEFMSALSELTNGQYDNMPNLKGLILDLRGNGGGYLNTAQRIANEFLERGDLILYAEGRSVRRVDSYADGSGLLRKVPLAILIDESSASASEIVSGAVQDLDRGYIVGRRSYGKGLVQQQYTLIDGSMVRLTIARYHTPSGRVIQTPYIEGNKEQYTQKHIERLLSDERFSKDSIKTDDSLLFRTLKLSRKVYGGGGIIPDEFIPIDTSYYSTSYLKRVNSGYLTEFVQTYADQHRDQIVRLYPDYEDFVARFNVSQEYLDLYLNDSKSRGVEYSSDELIKSSNEIKRHLKGLIIRNIYGLDKYLRFSHKSDKDVLKAVKLLTDNSTPFKL